MPGKDAYKITRGKSHPLGSNPDSSGVNFAIYSKHASNVELCIIEADGRETRMPLPARTDDIWHGHVEGLKAGQVYGYRIDGPRDPANGHFFDPDRLLLDPYAQEITDDYKSRIAPPLPPLDHARPKISWPDTFIYEAHLRGMTMELPGIPDDIRGTFKAFGHDTVIDHLKKLGVTSVELLPVQAFMTEPHLSKKGLTNYWGYNTAGFFAPHPSYGSREDFRAMAEKLHDAGIEIILDVVYNHTCEGQPDLPSVSFRGIDNASYYRLRPNDKSQYDDYSGCGNTLDTNSPAVCDMITDSLRYWAETMGADGFRFDLALALARDKTGAFNASHPLLEKIAADPVLSKAKLIAEPWDIRGYELGNFPPGWHEWNDKFRDNMRGYWRGDTGAMKHKATRLSGSHPEFGRKGGPPAGINFITAHDGFTLHDLVSYNNKHNEKNGEENRDGHGNNISCNHGIEGKTNDSAVMENRERHKRALLASLLLSQGTPMLLSGDECANSQDGNNNAYCHDNPTGWVNWEGPDLINFIGTLAGLRRDFPILRHQDFMHGFNICSQNVRDIQWHGPDGKEMQPHHWDNPAASCFGMLLNGAAHIKNGTKYSRLYMVFNGHSHPVSFELPQIGDSEKTSWKKIFDTASGNGEPVDVRYLHQTRPERIEARTVNVFVQIPQTMTTGPGHG